MSARSSRYFAALWVPKFQLQAALRNTPIPPHEPVALLDCDEEGHLLSEENKSRVLHANEVAEKYHVSSGMTPSQAQARCVTLRLLRRHPETEAEVHQLLMDCAVSWTPDYESSQPGLCVLDLSQVRDVASRAAVCGQEMWQWLKSWGLHAQVGLAPHPDLACLAARAAQPVLALESTPENEDELLKRLPITALQPSAAIAKVLALWGVTTLAQFAALQREDIASRLGVEGALLWDVAKGGRERLLKLVRPPADFRETFEFEHPVEMMEPLLFMLRRMLNELCRRLADLWLVASAARLELRFEDGQTYERTLRVAEATRDAELLLRVLHTHLEGRNASAPIVALTLELMPVRPSNLQTQLFERRLRDPNQFSETLARLEALLGHGNVGRVELLPSRRPDAFAVTNFLETKTAAPSQPPERLAYGLPLWRFRPPVFVDVILDKGRPSVIHAPAGCQTITEARGPWLMSGDWWDKHRWTREVWEVITENGALFQLASEPEGWVLDGTFA